MSRRSQAHAVRVLVEGTTGTRSWQIAVRVPQTRAQREQAGEISARRRKILKDAKTRSQQSQM